MLRQQPMSSSFARNEYKNCSNNKTMTSASSAAPAIEIDLRKPPTGATSRKRTGSDPWSYFFVEVTADAQEQKLAEFMVGYCYNIHIWSSDLSKRMVSSRYLMILKVKSNTGARDLYKKVREMAAEQGFAAEKKRYRDVYDSIFIDFKALAKLIGEAVRELQLDTEVYRGLEELMVKGA